MSALLVSACPTNSLYREEQTRLATRLQELQALEGELQQARNHVKDCERQEAEHKKQKRDLQVEQQKASAILDRLEGELSEATPDASAIKEAERDLEDAKAQAETAKVVLDDVGDQIVEYDTSNRMHKREMDDAANRVADLESQLNKAKETV